MTSETSVAQRQLRPFWGRVTVLESPVDEEERESGLIVPLLAVQGEKVDPVHRGVVLHIDQTYHDTEGHWNAYARQINSGTVVYFKDGRRILDTWVVDIADVLAFELDDDA